MGYISIDVESDSPTAASGSMVCFGAVMVSDLSKTFYGKTHPIADNYKPDSLKISGFTREQHEQFDDPKIVMQNFADWIKENNIKGRPIFISDNNGYDFAWIAFYFDLYGIINPFGWSSRRISDLYCGMKNDTFAKWKYLRDTKHDHNPVNDAMSNAEVILKMKQAGLRIKI